MVETKSTVASGPARQSSVKDDGALPRRRRGRSARPLGPFAYLTLQAVDGICSTVGEQFASGMNVEEVASQRLGELVDTGQVYVTLRRLQEDRNLLHAKEVRSPNGSGHMVTVYTVTDAGRVAMDTSAAFYAAVSDRAALLREIAEASFVATPKHGVAAHGKPQSKTKKGPTRK